MFNHSVYFDGNNTSMKVNSVSGGIVKNTANSFFLRFNLKSELSKTLLSPKPYRMYKGKYNNERQDVEVLQLVIVGDMEVVAEIIDIPKEREL